MVAGASSLFVGSGGELVVLKVRNSRMEVAWNKPLGVVADLDLRESLLLVGLADGTVTCMDIRRPQHLADKTQLSTPLFHMRGGQGPALSAVVGWHPSMQPLACSAVGRTFTMLDLRSR